MSPKDTGLDELFTRGVGEFVDPDNIFRKKITENPSSVVIKFGVDPTRQDIHLGHAVILRKLRKFQDLGAKVIFLIGDITAQIGDPTGKSKIRPEVSQQEIEANMKTYLDQVGKILITDNPAVFSWIRNSDWFVSINDIIAPDNEVYEVEVEGKKTTHTFPGHYILAKALYWVKTRMQKNKIHNYSFLNILSFLRKITLSRLLERDMFQERLKKGEAVYMHELMYPILQGIDSAAIHNYYGSCDLEVGGTDQTFNMLVGRDIMQLSGQSPQAVLSFELLEGLDGKEKMSKSLDNYISIIDSPQEIYGKILSLPDDLIVRYFTLCTYRPIDSVEDIEKKLKSGKENPKEIKMSLAHEIVTMYHGTKEADKAEADFIAVFSQGGIPENILEVRVAKGSLLRDVLVEHTLVPSNTEFRRLVDQKAVEFLEPSRVVESYDEIVDTVSIIKVGKKRFLKIIPS